MLPDHQNRVKVHSSTQCDCEIQREMRNGRLPDITVGENLSILPIHYVATSPQVLFLCIINDHHMLQVCLLRSQANKEWRALSCGTSTLMLKQFCLCLAFQIFSNLNVCLNGPMKNLNYVFFGEIFMCLLIVHLQIQL